MNSTPNPQVFLSPTDFFDLVFRAAPSVAAFDCDGTLWSGDSGEGFFNWVFDHHMVSDEVIRWARQRHADYKAGKVSEDDMCGEMVTLHQGLAEAEVDAAAAEFFREKIFPQIFPEMMELLKRLQQGGCEIWAVSSTNEWVVRQAVSHFGISPERVLAGKALVEKGIITGKLLRLPSGPGKAVALREVAQRSPDAAFGNSRWDVDMLRLAKNPFAVNPNPDLEELARREDWPVYFPESVRP